MITNLNSILSKGDAGYVDLSNAVEFEPSSSNGCLTIIATSNSTRLQISKSILADLDEPEAVKIHIDDKHIAIFSTQAVSFITLSLLRRYYKFQVWMSRKKAVPSLAPTNYRS